MSTQNTGFKAFSNKINSTAPHPVHASNDPTETAPKPSDEPEKIGEPDKDAPKAK